MTEEIHKTIEQQIQKAIETQIVPAIKETVEKTVNGKVDKLTIAFNDHRLEIAPLLDGLRVIQSLQKFFKWIGLPFIVVLTPLWLWLRNI